MSAHTVSRTFTAYASAVTSLALVAGALLSATPATADIATRSTVDALPARCVVDAVSSTEEVSASPSASASATASPSVSASASASPNVSASVSPDVSPSEMSSVVVPTASTSPSATPSAPQPTTDPSARIGTVSDDLTPVEVGPSPSALPDVSATPTEVADEIEPVTVGSTVACPVAAFDLSASAGMNEVVLSWGLVGADEDAGIAAATSVYVVTSTDGEPDRVEWIDTDATEATVTGLRNGVEYRFTVYAATDDGRSEASDVVSATPTTGADGEVAGLIVALADGAQLPAGSTDVPGADAVEQVGLQVTGQVSDEAMLVELSEAVSLDAAEQIAADLSADPAVAWAEPDLFLFSASDPTLELPTGTALSGERAVPVGNSVTTNLASTGRSGDLATPVSVPSDTAYAEQWSLWDRYGIGVGDGAASMTNAWANGRGAGATVAVIDTGITSHPDLDGNVLPGFDFVSNPDGLATDRDGSGTPVAFDADYADTVRFGGLGRDDNPTDPGDWRGVAPVRGSSWHGTAMAGIIAAANNADGVTGIAPDAKIVPVRALSWRGGLLSDIAASITWARGGAVDGAPVNANPADVINLSFAVQAACPVALQAAITDARARGAVLVAAAGNAGMDAGLFAPGNCDGVLTIAATGRDGQRAGYSNYGTRVDLSAPGGSNDGGTVLAPSNVGTREPVAATTLTVEELPTSTALSPERAVLVGNSNKEAEQSGSEVASGATYRGQLGTSVAAAHVSGAIALLKARNTTLTPDDIERQLTGSVRPFANDAFDPTDPTKTGGTGILSLAQIAAGTCVPTSPYTTDGGKTMIKFLDTGSCTWEVPAGVSQVLAVIVGGGGGGGAGDSGSAAGGGGAGAVRVETLDVTAGNLMDVYVGVGVLGGQSAGDNGVPGDWSSINGGGWTPAGVVRAYGGGYGAGGNSGGAARAGALGGSGGGGGAGNGAGGTGGNSMNRDCCRCG